jgi:gamma-D-glutamyl-L-lysine dipeptidyl-peptidase
MNAICVLSVVPVRSEPSDKAEMVTQLLFGEQVQILEEDKSWRKVRLLYDDYTGWVDFKQIRHIEEEEVKKFSEFPPLSYDLVQIAINGTSVIPIVLGSTLPFYHDKKIHIGTSEYEFDGSAKIPARNDFSSITEYAAMYLNAPYLWGGRSPFGIDCSGFTQMVYKLCGIRLKRDTHQQVAQGKSVSNLDSARPGDLAFFRNEAGKVNHTGILLTPGRIMHAHGKVRIDKVDSEGIFNAEQNRYTHFLSHLRRME